MAVNFQAVLLPHQRRSDGANIIRIRITHNRQSKWIKTSIVLSAKDQTKDGKPKSRVVMRPAYDLIDRMTDVVNHIDLYKLQAMSVDALVTYINNALKEPEQFKLDFIEYGRKIALTKNAGTAATYNVAMNALERFFKGEHPDISEITVKKLREFEEFINNEKVVKVNWRTGKQRTLKKEKKGRAASLYLANVRHIYKSARKEFNEPDLNLFPIPNDPFEYYQVPKIPASEHRDIEPEVIQLMIDTRKQLKGRQRQAIDCFLISFGLCGLNATDMYKCAKPNKKGILYYRRSKTEERRDDHAEMYVKVYPCIAEIMKDYKDNIRCFDFYKRYSSRDTFITALNAGLKGWITKYKQKPFSFYTSKHSWGTIGNSKRCKIDSKIITVGLCHVDENSRMDDVYVRFDWELLWDAQKTILDVFNWHDL